jgi:glutamate 5-kinase
MSSPPPQRHKRIVIKIGSNVIASRAHGLHEERIAKIAEVVASLFQAGHLLFLVSSGAVLCGAEALGLKQKPALTLKQAAAAVGQSRLMWAYEKCFAPYRIRVAQILLTGEDLADRTRFINARNTLRTLTDHHILPIINENDTVAVDEIKVGDNDRLAALVTHLVDASLLILLSDVDGLYTSDPRKRPDAQRIPVVEEITSAIEKMAEGTGTFGGTGGMASKVRAARQVAGNGASTLILNGASPELILRALEGEAVGTLFLPKPARLAARKGWIAHSSKIKGSVRLDAGAASAILSHGKSLLPSGISAVEGKFEVGDVVRCLAPDGRTIACGLTNYGTSEMTRIAGRRSSEIMAILGYKPADEAIHRNNMVLHDAAQKREE